MTYKGFRIVNTPAYIWRIYCWGSHAGHNNVACWYVFDAEGKQVTGGYTAGNNTRSGTVDMARRKDAKAWVDGYCAYRDEPENRQVCGNGAAVYAPTHGKNHRDSELQASFDAGYWDAQRPTRRVAKSA
ncbi:MULTISPECIES: hypothetical protein [Bacteria]|jgi:hypothetical protein|uniref:hypothetical protein n=1 Tax=Bacteria TaxID=2 RepID=UPI0018E853A8|nr:MULTISPECIES: hypothetical protein [Pseudomonas]MBJ2286643.1 hypothetical protein [Pseudomonas sp. MF6755]MDH0796204.1 hypothetical protein [Pseudomonas carnis]